MVNTSTFLCVVYMILPCLFFSLQNLYASEEEKNCKTVCALNMPFFTQKELRAASKGSNEMRTFGHTSLLHFCYLERLEEVRMLLENGVDFECKDRREETALSLACKRNSDSVVELLLQHRADVNHTNNYGESLLYHSCSVGDQKRAELFSRYGAFLLLKTQIDDFSNSSKCLSQRCNDIIKKRTALLYYLLNNQKSSFTCGFLVPDVIQDQIICGMLGHQKPVTTE